MTPGFMPIRKINLARYAAATAKHVQRPSPTVRAVTITGSSATTAHASGIVAQDFSLTMQHARVNPVTRTVPIASVTSITAPSVRRESSEVLTANA